MALIEWERKQFSQIQFRLKDSFCPFYKRPSHATCVKTHSNVVRVV